MKLVEVNKIIKELRIRKGYSLKTIAEMIPVSTQGYHYWEQGLRTWKLETLSILSKILDFEIKIKDGEIDIIPNISPTNNKRVVNIMSNIKEEKSKLIGYEVIEVYTLGGNINFQYDEILETCLIYKTLDNFIEEYPNEAPVRLYVLYDIENGDINDRTLSLSKVKALSMYYWNYAPSLDSNGTIYIDYDKQIKISKRYVQFDLNNQNEDGSYNVISINPLEVEQSLGMFKTTDLNNRAIPQINLVSESFPEIAIN